jgi:hypothetical protein
MPDKTWNKERGERRKKSEKIFANEFFLTVYACLLCNEFLSRSSVQKNLFIFAFHAPQACESNFNRSRETWQEKFFY